jgi:predicted MPP superfamily phosphohydrolase
MSHLAETRHDLFIKDLDPAHDGLVIAQLSDIHVGPATPRRKIRRAVELANAAKPDLVFLTGDYIGHGRKWVPAVSELLSGLEAKEGVFSVLGNHDYWADGEGVAKAIESAGYAMLRNQNATQQGRGAPRTIVGVDDPVSKNHHVPRANHGVPRSGTQLCLVHCPEVAPEIATRGAQMIVAGHTHGGQFHFKRATPWVFRNLLKRQYVYGWYAVDDARLYVNRGIGAGVVSLRVGEGAKAEVAVFTLRRAE